MSYPSYEELVAKVRDSIHSEDTNMRLSARWHAGKFVLCERALSNTLPPKPLNGISPAAVLLAGRQDAAPATEKPPLRPRVNAPLRVNVKLNRAESSAQEKSARVKGA